MEHTIVCGIDEAGRGPLWGPVTAAAVIFPPGIIIDGLRDSKKLSALQRAKLEQRIRASCFWGLGWASSQEIDEINILQASLLSMVRAWDHLVTNFQAQILDSFLQNGIFTTDDPQELQLKITILTDGSIPPRIPAMKVSAIVKGDSLIPEISAASVLAKTARDRWVTEWVEANDPLDTYGLAKHKGYPTSFHREMIRIHGPNDLHRLSFKST